MTSRWQGKKMRTGQYNGYIDGQILLHNFSRGCVGMAQSVYWLYSQLTRNQEQNKLKKKKSWNCWKKKLYSFLKIWISHLLSVFPLKYYIEKAQRIVSGLGPSPTIVHAVTGCDGSLWATGGFPIDAFGHFRQVEPHQLYFTSAPINKSCHLPCGFPPKILSCLTKFYLSVWNIVLTFFH